jgi:hypothetical protein
MAGLGIRLFTDEMVSGALALALRVRGYDVESCVEAGRANLGISDKEQLEYSTQQGRAILTFNARDFLALDHAYKGAGRLHAGIVLSAQIDDIGLLVRSVQRHLDTVQSSIQHNTLLWLALGATFD